jgi:hypothetical protein
VRQVLHTEKMIDSFRTNELKDWVSKVTKFVNKTTRMIDSSLITINEIPLAYRNKIIQNFAYINKIETSKVVILNGLRLTVRNNSHLCQNFSINYISTASKLNFGLIVDFFKYNNKLYAIVQKLTKKKTFSSEEEIEKRLSLFFLIGILIDDYDIVSLENILKKCVIIENNDEFFISICNDINEHD